METRNGFIGFNAMSLLAASEFAKGKNMHSELFGLFLLVVIPLVVWIEFKARQRREDTRQKAHEKVIELRQQGTEAEVCSKCSGKGRVGIITYDCPKCGGIGYSYELEE